MEINQKTNNIYPLTTVCSKLGNLLVAFIWKITGEGEGN